VGGDSARPRRGRARHALSGDATGHRAPWIANGGVTVACKYGLVMRRVDLLVTDRFTCAAGMRQVQRTGSAYQPLMSPTPLRIQSEPTAVWMLNPPARWPAAIGQ
jgi:hypothetical protein